MLRHTILAAGLALGAASLTVGAGLLPAQATTTAPPSLRVVAPCDGGAGTVAFTTSKTATGTAARAAVSGVTHSSWEGAVYIKNPPTQDKKYTATKGAFSASTTSTSAWPVRAAGAFVSSDGSTMCAAGSVINASGAEAVSAQTDLVLRPGTRIVRVAGEDLAAGTWTVVVKLTTPAGFQKKTATVTIPKSGKLANSYSTSFTGFKKIGGFTRAVVTATSHNGKHTASLTFTRTA